MHSFAPRLAALALATSWLSGCAQTISSGCPPVPDYDRALRLRAATELAALPPQSALERMLDDYAVMRAQARACRR